MINKILLNNELITATAACIEHNDRGLLLADGLFETMYADSGKIPFISDHWQRLQQGANILALELPLTLMQLHNMAVNLLQANHLQTQAAILRLTITRGTGARGVAPPEKINPTILLTASPYVNPPQNLTLHRVKIKRNEFSPLANIKSLNYLENVLAKQEALRYGADDALLCNTQGDLAEASAANIFIATENKLLTPRLRDGALAGVIRKQILALAEKLSVACGETQITLQQTLQAEEVFVTNSVLKITPVIKIDQKNIGDGKIGVITQRLQQALQQLIERKIQDDRPF